MTSVSSTTRLLIGGEPVAALEGGTRTLINPATGEDLAIVSEAAGGDVDRAVASAANAFAIWGSTSPSERARILYRIADQLDDHSAELALIETRNAGKPLAESEFEVGAAAAVFRYYAAAVDKFFGQTIPVDADGLAFTVREPIGVAALIVPWNYPLYAAAVKVAPALAAANTAVLKPAELTPLSALRLGEIALDAGLPAGVLNVVPGAGTVVGRRLVEHRDVGKVSFTGSTAVGIDVARRAAATMKRVTLELGGKSACLVFPDADLDRVGELAPRSVFANAGQDCCARSRLIVHESVADEVVQRFVATTEALRVGLPDDPATEIGPLISEDHRRRVQRFVEEGRRDGAEVVTGGTSFDGPLADGYFFAPTVLHRVDERMTIAQEEIFGPVAAVMTFRDEDEAVRLANGTRYGLSGSIWTTNAATALRVARRVRSGQLSVNSNSSVFIQAPMGGYKHSGVGKDLGMQALEHNSELKFVFMSSD